MVIQNMKKMFHRIGALAVAFMMALSLAVPALAATTASGLASHKNTVKVSNAVPGATYSLYKLLQLDGVVETKGEEGNQTTSIVSYRYSYDEAIKKTIEGLVTSPDFAYRAGTPTPADPMLGFGFKVDGDNDLTFVTPTTSDTDGSVDYDSEENGIVRTMMVKFADELRKLVDTNSLTVFTQGGKTYTETAPAAAEGEKTSAVEFKDVPSGYWMVTSNAGARSIVFTNPGANLPETMEVFEKNPAPTIDKWVLDVDDAGGDITVENGKASWRETNDAKIGDTVTYKITVELYKGAENIIVYDDMSEGLTFKSLDNVKFYPRNEDGTTGTNSTDGRQVYLAGNSGATTSELSLVETRTEGEGENQKTVVERDGDGNATFKTDVAKLDVNANKHGFTITFSNKFTNPAADAGNRDEKDDKNNVFLGDLANLEDDGGRVEIEYTATLNENAAVKGESKFTCAKTEHTHDDACRNEYQELICKKIAHTHDDACTTDSNVNESYVRYGHIHGVNPGEDPKTPTDPPNKTTEDKTETYTYKFQIDKYVKGNSETKLEGAKFQLRSLFIGIGKTAVTNDNGKFAWIGDDGNLNLPPEDYKTDDTLIKLVDVTPTTAGDNDGKVYRVATPEEIKAGSAMVDEKAKDLTDVIVTNKSGQITIQGLDSRLYSITETEAPKGYVKLTNSEMIAIGSAFSGNGGTVFTEKSQPSKDNPNYIFEPVTGENPVKVNIENASGIQMPITGGIGTTIFYAVGGILVLGAGVLLVVKKRAGRTED